MLEKRLRALLPKNIQPRQFMTLAVIVMTLVALGLGLAKVQQPQDKRSRADDVTINLSLEGPTQPAQANQTFPVDVYAEGTGMIGIALGVRSQNSSVLEIQSIESTGLFPTLLQAGTVQDGVARITVGSSTTAISGRIKIATLQVRALQNGSTLLEFVDTEGYDATHDASNIGQLLSSTITVGQSSVPNPVSISTDVTSPVIPLGQTSTVDVRFDTVHRVTAAVVCVNYNSNVLEFVSSQQGPSFPTLLLSGPNSDGQRCMTVGIAPSNEEPQDRGVTGQFIAASFTFRGIGVGSSPVGCGSNIDIAANGFGSETNLIGQCTGGSITVTQTGGNLTSTPIPTGIGGPTNAPLPTSVPNPTTGTNPTSVPNPTSGTNPTSIPNPTTGTNPTSVPNPTARPTLASGACRANVTGPLATTSNPGVKDNMTDILDINLFLELFRLPSPSGIVDFDANGRVDIHDFQIMVLDFGCIEAGD